jgi:hypothetical protein
MKETVGQSNPEDLEASRPETKSGIADELAETRKDATSSSRDISTRIPKIDLSKLGFQGVVVTPEDRVAMVREDAIPEQVPWLHKLALLRQFKALEDDLNTSNDVSGHVRATIDNIAKRLSKEALQLEAQQLFEYPGAARAFDKLLTRFAIESGQLDQLVTELKLREDFDGRLLAIIDPSFVNDNYKFSKALLGSGTSQPNCMKIIELHADALASAADRLREAEKTLKAHFDENLQRCIEQGIIPASAQPAAGSPRETRYKALAVLASDPLSNSLAHKGGHFGLTDNVIQIDASIVLTDKLDGVYDHERLHALSGATVVLDDTDLYDEEGDYSVGDDMRYGKADVQQVFDEDTIDDGKVQPAFLLKGRRFGLSSKFNDINEAYTEWAAMQLRGDSYNQEALWRSFNELYAEQMLSENNAEQMLSENNLVIGNDQDQREQWKKFVEEYGWTYLENRIMMAGLVHAGVDMLVLGEAYFESYEPKRSNPDREPGNAAPARWALDRAIAEHTPYKSLEQLQKALDVLAKERLGAERLGPIARKNTRWYKAALLSELLQPGTKEAT